MASPVGRAPTVVSPEHHPPTKGTVIFSYACVTLTGAAIIVVLIVFCRCRVRRRAPVAVGGAEDDSPREERRQVGVDVAKLPAFAYAEPPARLSGGGGARCSVCLGTVRAGEKVRRLPRCRHLYHAECIDAWLASRTTCPLCRADVEPPAGDGQAASAEQDQAPPV